MDVGGSRWSRLGEIIYRVDSTEKNRISDRIPGSDQRALATWNSRKYQESIPVSFLGNTVLPKNTFLLSDDLFPA
jgi:hypothetical protein